MFLPPLSDEENLSLTKQIYYGLKQAILSSQIKPREYLVIGDIANYYGISRTPVREAIIMLEREGWVIQDARRGAKVIVPSSKDIIEVLEMQMILEGFVARKAAEKMGEEDIAEADRILQESENALEAGDEERCRQLGAKFHNYISQFVENKQIIHTITKLQDQVDRVRFLVFHEGKAPVKTSAQQHRSILNAIKERNSVKAEELMFHHITWFEKLLTDSNTPMLD